MWPNDTFGPWVLLADSSAFTLPWQVRNQSLLWVSPHLMPPSHLQRSQMEPNHGQGVYAGRRMRLMRWQGVTKWVTNPLKLARQLILNPALPWGLMKRCPEAQPQGRNSARPKLLVRIPKTTAALNLAQQLDTNPKPRPHPATEQTDSEWFSALEELL